LALLVHLEVTVQPKHREESIGNLMHWLLYSAKKDRGFREIERSLEEALGPDCSKIQGGIAKVGSYLSGPHEVITHALLLVSGEDDLVTLEKYRDQIREWCTVIGTLGVGEDNMMRMALRFLPRFVAILPEEKHHLRLVVNKMIQNHRTKTVAASENRKEANPRNRKERENGE
jgi:hypothetical protein